jgi:hypothetical protein
LVRPWSRIVRAMKDSGKPSAAFQLSLHRVRFGERRRAAKSSLCSVQRWTTVSRHQPRGE